MTGRPGWRPIAAWAASVLVLVAVGMFRLTVDALTCGDDGPADNWDQEAVQYCDVLGDQLGVSAVSIHATFDPGSMYWFVVAVPSALLAGVLALRRTAFRDRAVAIAAGWAVVALVLLPAAFASPGFALYYVLPIAGALAVSLVALGRARGRIAVASLVAGAAVSALLAYPSFAVS